MHDTKIKGSSIVFSKSKMMHLLFTKEKKIDFYKILIFSSSLLYKKNPKPTNQPTTPPRPQPKQNTL